DVLRSFELDDALYMGHAFPTTAADLLAPGTTVAIRIFDMDEIRRLLGVGGQLTGIATGRHRAIGAPVKGPVPGDDLMPAGIESGQLYRILDGSSATDGEQRLLQVARSDLRQLLTELTTGLRCTGGRDIAYLLHLADNGIGHPLIAMTDVHVHQARR